MCFFDPWGALANTVQHWEAGDRTGVIAVANIFHQASKKIQLLSYKYLTLVCIRHILS